MKNTITLTKTTGLLNPNNINFKEVIVTDESIAFPITQVPDNRDSYIWTLSDLTCLLAADEKSDQLYFVIEQDLDGTEKYMFTTYDDFSDIGYFEPTDKELEEITLLKNIKDGKKMKRFEITAERIDPAMYDDHCENFAYYKFADSLDDIVTETYNTVMGTDYKVMLKGKDDLFLRIEAKEGYNLLDYDGNYNIYLWGISSRKDPTFEAKMDITDSITEDEAKLIQRVLWNNRSTTRTYFHMAERALSAKYPDIKFTRFANDMGWEYCDNQWYGVFKTNDNRWLIATTGDTNTNKPEFEFQLIG